MTEQGLPVIGACTHCKSAQHLRLWTNGIGGYWCQCGDCLTSGPLMVTEREAIEAWNALGQADADALAACEAVWENWYETYARPHLSVYGAWDGLRIPEHVTKCCDVIAKAKGEPQ